MGYSAVLCIPGFATLMLAVLVQRQGLVKLGAPTRFPQSRYITSASTASSSTMPQRQVPQLARQSSAFLMTNPGRPSSSNSATMAMSPLAAGSNPLLTLQPALHRTNLRNHTGSPQSSSLSPSVVSQLAFASKGGVLARKAHLHSRRNTELDPPGVVGPLGSDGNGSLSPVSTGGSLARNPLLSQHGHAVVTRRPSHALAMDHSPMMTDALRRKQGQQQSQQGTGQGREEDPRGRRFGRDDAAVLAMTGNADAAVCCCCFGLL